jgi:hypothetical protein
LFQGQLATDSQGYLIVDNRFRTNIEGVWAAGEIGDPIFKQAITSAGMGAAAAIEAERWLAEHEDAPEPLWLPIPRKIALGVQKCTKHPNYKLAPMLCVEPKTDAQRPKFKAVSALA